MMNKFIELPIRLEDTQSAELGIARNIIVNSLFNVEDITLISEWPNNDDPNDLTWTRLRVKGDDIGFMIMLPYEEVKAMLFGKMCVK